MNTEVRPAPKRPNRRPARLAAAVLTLAVAATLAPAPALSAQPAVVGNVTAEKKPKKDTGDWAENAYRGQVQVIEGSNPKAKTITGVVFDDRDRDSVQDRRERGINGVTVSNGRDVVTTDRNGRYRLPVYENMTVFVTQPRGYQVPVDEDNIAQFSYHHLPEGSPELKFGGIAPTGPVPKAVNFPVTKSRLTQSPQQHCLIGGDIQTYKPVEADYASNGAFADLAERTDYAGCGALFIGDIVGDDLSLYPGIRELSRTLNGPARFLPGNHDLDFDAPSSEHAFDTFRDEFGPEYYSYDSGKAHVVALSTVEYPLEGDSSYNGSIDERQMEWLRNDIAQVPKNKVIVLAGHIPLLDFADQGSKKHQIDQVAEIYEILEGREVVALGGHTHSLENLRKGDSMEGWKELFGVDGLPFAHITAGAISGDWYNGRLLPAGYPTAVQRDGAQPGVLTLDIKNTKVTERFTVRGQDDAHQMALGLNTPAYRDWYAQNIQKKGSAPIFRNALRVPQADLGQTWLTTNFFMGSTGSTVQVSVDGRDAVEATRTQQMQGEGQLVGVEYSDPAAVQEQLVHGGSVADRSMHLWRLNLPADLSVGMHTAEVTATDVHGRSYAETLKFEVTE